MRVSRNEGVGLGTAMERFGWKKVAGPAPSVLLGLNGSKVMGLSWMVQGWRR